MQKLTSAEIRTQLERLLSSPKLSGSIILPEFLRFIVNETLAGRGNTLKEYNIGVQALKRGNDFNPQLDSIVRIHAGRLRRVLKTYYHEEGIEDPIVIDVPKGSYVPNFELRSRRPDHDGLHFQFESGGNEISKDIFLTPGSSSSDRRPTIGVLPFKKTGGGDKVKYFSEAIGEYLRTELTKFRDLRVATPHSDNQTFLSTHDVQSIGSILGVDYLLTGTVHGFNESHTRVFVQLNFVGTGHQLWAKTYERKNSSLRYSAFLDEVVEKILASIAGLDGVIERHGFTRPKMSSQQQEIPISYWYHLYRKKFDKGTTASAKIHYQNIVKREPENALTLAYLSEILSNEGFIAKKSGKNSIDFGRKYAVEALKIDPHAQQGYLALAISALCCRDLPLCTYAIEEGLRLNSKCNDYKSTLGAMLIYAGELEFGGQLLEKAVNLNSNLPWWQTLGYSLYLFHKKSYRQALRWVNYANKNIVWTPLVKAACYIQLGQPAKAELLMGQLKQQFRVDSSYPAGLQEIFSSQKLLKDLTDGLSDRQTIFPSENADFDWLSDD